MAIVRYRALRGAAALLFWRSPRARGKARTRWAGRGRALERNDRLEVVAADQHSGTFTVRVKDTGELRMVRADQLIAGPSLSATAPAAAATTAGTAAPAQRRRSLPTTARSPAPAKQQARKTPARSPHGLQPPRRPRRRGADEC